jgi:hypothetical protein
MRRHCCLDEISDAKIIALASATEGKLHGKGPEILTA